MADYWKSQARKYCDFCKCWIADNKPSIKFHETGKRHKENVAQKLSQLTKQSLKDKKESLKVDEEMKKMEEAAMKAYLKDIESNPDFTSQVIKDKVEERRRQKEEEQEKNAEGVKPKVEVEAEPTTSSEPPTDAEPTKEKEEEEDEGQEKEKLWQEAKSDEGYTYYWNYATGESRWEPPEEGYVSIEEQTKMAEETELPRSSDAEDISKEEKEEEEEKKMTLEEDEESTTDKEKKDNRKRKKVEDVPAEEEESSSIGPMMKPDPYGGWTSVERRVEEPIDWQLPHQEFVKVTVPASGDAAAAEPEFKFKEKKIATGLLGDDRTTFKKRKFSARGNARQRLDDD